MARTFYRFVAGDPPTARDFASNFLLGRPRRAAAGETEDDWRGLSVFDSPPPPAPCSCACPGSGCACSPGSSSQIPDDAPVRVAKTFGPGHYTLWGDPQLLRDAVVAVTRIEG